MQDEGLRAAAEAGGRRSAPREGRGAGGAAGAVRARVELLGLGLIWGLVVPLSSLAADFGASPLALTGWVSAVSACFCAGVALRRGAVAMPDAGGWCFVLAWALLGTVLPQTLLFWVASRIDSNTISVVVILEGFIVFAIASALRVEKPTLRRLAGLALGFAGIVPILSGATARGGDAGIALTLLAALGLPLCYALENLLIARFKPPELDPVAGIALMQAIGAAIAFAVAGAGGEAVRPHLIPGGPGGPGALGGLVVALGLCAALANILFQRLILTSGPVFTSQCSYLITLAGIGWGALLLGETVSPWIGASLGTLFVGVMLVAPEERRTILGPQPGLPAAGRADGP